MRPLLSYLPYFLTLVVPLGLLAWLGGAELSRLTERSRWLLREEAHRFLTTEERKVREEIQDLVWPWLDERVPGLLGDADATLVTITQQLVREPFILDLFVADEDFAVLAPRPSRFPTPSAPLHDFPRDEDDSGHHLARADLLFNLGDHDGAISAYETYLERAQPDQTFGRVWAHFHVAGLYDRGGDAGKAADRYYLAATLAESLYPETREEDTATVMLLSALRRAQISLDLEQLLDVLRNVGEGRYEYLASVPSDIVTWVVREIATHVPSDPRWSARLQDMLAHDRIRSLGRQFADQYTELVQRELATAHRAGRKRAQRGVIYHVMTTDRSVSLLALRPAHHAELRRFPGAAWVGLRLDLPALVGSSLSIRPTSKPGNIALAVTDPSGIALVSSPEPAANTADVEFPPIVSALGGLEFVAVPITDPGSVEYAERNRMALGLILILIALGGAFLLMRAVRRESELARLKVQLLSRVSHELKTPLAVIKMFGETLGMGRARDADQQREFAGIIAGEADRMTGMVERILDFSKMEQGRFRYHREPVDLAALIAQVCAEYRPHAAAQGFEIRSVLPGGLHVIVDPDALSGALVNFLDNAVKYSSSPTADHTLEVELLQQDREAVLEVRDRGVGIPTAELGRVFEDFYRASNAGEVRGAGLGLSLVHHFARHHQGRVEARNRPGGGTTMRLTLPLVSPPASLPPAPPPLPAEAPTAEAPTAEPPIAAPRTAAAPPRGPSTKAAIDPP